MRRGRGCGPSFRASASRLLTDGISFTLLQTFRGFASGSVLASFVLALACSSLTCNASPESSNAPNLSDGVRDILAGSSFLSWSFPDLVEDTLTKSYKWEMTPYRTHRGTISILRSSVGRICSADCTGLRR